MNTPRRTGMRVQRVSPSSTRGRSSRTLIPSAVLLGALAAVAAPTPTQAQSTETTAAETASVGSGVVSGRVFDASTGRYLEGAEVIAVGTSLKAVADREGMFTLNGVPSGEQTIVISYLGMEDSKTAVSVSANETARVEVKMNPEILRLEDFTVTGTREGMAQAIVLQKVSVQTKLVAAGDQFGPVSEGNVGEYLKFLPGVTIDYNVNDARGVSLRGLSSAFSTITVDGTPVASGSSNSLTRRFELEQVAANNIETYEIYKTVTPDLPATSTGGFVNAITKSAFDHDETQRISYDLSFGGPSTNYNLFTKASGVWSNTSHYTVRPNLDLNVSRKITEKVGLNISYRYSDKYDDAPRQISTYSLSTGTPVLTQFDIASEQKLTHRESLAGRLDFKFTENTKLAIDAAWYNYDLIFTQRYLRFALGSNSTIDGDTVTSGTSGTRTITNATLQRRKYGDTYHFSGTFEHKFGDESVLKLTPYISIADAYYADTEYGYISGSATYSLSSSSSAYNRVSLTGFSDLTKAPTVTLYNATSGAVAAADFLRTLSNYTLSNSTSTSGWGSSIQSRPWHARDIKDGLNGSYTRDLFTGDVPVKLDVGFAYDEAYRRMVNYDYRIATSSVTSTALAALRDIQYSEDVAFGYGSAQFIDPYKLWEAYATATLNRNSLDIYRFEEDNLAGYARFDITPFKDFLVVTGVRWEQREIDALTQRWAVKRSTSSGAAIERYTYGASNLKYDSFYPSLTLKYTPRKWLVLRGGASRTVGNPDYGDLVTSVQEESIIGSDGSVTYSSKNLKPYFVNNYDIGADYYLGSTGVFGVSLFYKQMDNYISQDTSLTDDEKTAIAEELGLDDISDYSSWAITKNGGKADFKGFEVSYAQNFTFLPKPFNGLNIQANYTYTDISSSDWDTEHSLKRGISPQTFNLIIGYRYGKFNTTITNNWVDESLYSGYVGTTWSSNGFYYMKDDRWQTDVKVEYSINKYVSVYFMVRNIFNAPRDEFLQGNTEATENIRVPYRYGEFGEPYYTFGFRGKF